jgi:hypothetical protein
MDEWKIPPYCRKLLWPSSGRKKQMDIEKKARKAGGTTNFESDDESGEEEEDEENYEAHEEDDTEDDAQPSNQEENFGTILLREWERRSDSLIHSYSIAGWILSPCLEIQQDAKMAIRGPWKEKVNELLVKLYVPHNLSTADRTVFQNKMLCDFWHEWEAFNSRISRRI